MNLHDLIEAGAVTSEQYGRLHVIRVELPGVDEPQEFASTRGFDDAMYLAELGVKWEPMGVVA